MYYVFGIEAKQAGYRVNAAKPHRSVRQAACGWQSYVPLCLENAAAKTKPTANI